MARKPVSSSKQEPGADGEQQTTEGTEAQAADVVASDNAQADPEDQPGNDTAQDDDASADDQAQEPGADGVASDDEADADDDEPVDLALLVIPMTHPEGGTCDAYEVDEDGNILVPVAEAGLMIEHGFVPVEG